MFFIKKNKIKYTIPFKYHVIFWISYFTFNIVRWGSYFNDYWYAFTSNLVEFPLHIILVYLNIYYLVPKFIIEKKYREYMLYLTIGLTIHYFVRLGLDYYLISEDVWPEAQGLHKALGFNHIITVTLGEIYVLGLVSAIKFITDFTIERRKNLELQELQSETELKYLKAQIQPHFFFNTLNNLYALTLQRSEKASEVVIRLSEIMKHVIYNVNQKKISLIKEINYVQNYIDLEKMRRGKTIESSIDIAGEIDNVLIPPLLFLPFVENSFKHGLNNGENIYLKMEFEKNGRWLNFRLRNNFDPAIQSQSKGGIGIINTRRRLELIYGDAFELETYPSDNEYRVVLKIPIKNEN